MGLRIISSTSITTNGTPSTNTTTALDDTVAGPLTLPKMVEKSGNSPESDGYLPMRTMLRLQPLDTPLHFKLSRLSSVTATVNDPIVSPNNPVFLEFQDKSQAPLYLATFCEVASKVLSVAWVARENE